jgi:type IV secretion system protein VirD4
MAKLCRATLLLALLVAGFGLAVICLQYPWLSMVILGGWCWRRRHTWHASGSYGTARLAGLLDLAGMLGEAGLILGGAGLSGRPSRWEAIRCLISPKVRAKTATLMMLAAFWRGFDRRFIRVKDYVHLLTVAPAGAGKSVSVIIPNLLSHRGSTVVIDPKGELFAATAEARRKMGHRVIRLDPFGVAGPARPIA